MSNTVDCSPQVILCRKFTVITRFYVVTAPIDTVTTPIDTVTALIHRSHSHYKCTMYPTTTLPNASKMVYQKNAPRGWANSRVLPMKLLLLVGSALGVRMFPNNEPGLKKKVKRQEGPSSMISLWRPPTPAHLGLSIPAIHSTPPTPPQKKRRIIREEQNENIKGNDRGRKYATHIYDIVFHFIFISLLPGPGAFTPHWYAQTEIRRKYDTQIQRHKVRTTRLIKEMI